MTRADWPDVREVSWVWLALRTSDTWWTAEPWPRSHR